MNKTLLSAILAITALGIIPQCAMATPQAITGNLETQKTIVFASGNVTSTISGTDGSLSAAFTPTFTVTSNAVTGGITYSGQVNTTTGNVTALGASTTPTTNCFIALANTTTSYLPTATAVTNALTSANTATTPNVIAYTMTLSTATTTTGSGTLGAFAWSTNKWQSSGGPNGVYSVTTSIGTTAVNNSYENTIDAAGQYQATLLLTFNT